MVIQPSHRPLRLMLFTLRGSIVPAIWKRVVGMMLLAVLVVLFEQRVMHTGVELGAVPLTLMGLTLAIFLGFRNSVAYERWWEARTLWGELLIVLRNLARQTVSLPDNLPRDEQRLRVHRLVAFAHALRHQLRGTPASDELARWLPPSEAAALAKARGIPNALLGLIGESYAQLRRDGRLDPILLASIDAQLTRMSYVLGGCERIQGTPIPFAYLLLLHRTVYVYCLLLPFCLVGSVGWLTPVMVGVLAYTFFGLDALGDQIENPFDRLPNDLALDAMCRTIEISLGELLGDTDLPEPLQPVDGVLL
ncbi:bestrophin family protein [Dyella sp. C9]|uniref:bestrophin family protein n=1 Tax=Dyella sp. C9 TaxID=2202154 RepID=UPI000DEEE989|nr:bestrophin family ion channel [Dyella sp. C9]